MTSSPEGGPALEGDPAATAANPAAVLGNGHASGGSPGDGSPRAGPSAASPAKDEAEQKAGAGHGKQQQGSEGAAEHPGVPLPSEQLARAESGQDPSLPEAQLADPAAAAAAAVPGPSTAAATSTACRAASAPPPAGDRPDAAAAAAEAEAALGEATGAGGIPTLSSAEAARTALAASWAHAGAAGQPPAGDGFAGTAAAAATSAFAFFQPGAAATPGQWQGSDSLDADAQDDFMLGKWMLPSWFGRPSRPQPRRSLRQPGAQSCTAAPRMGPAVRAAQHASFQKPFGF
jgi:hypothetical protein